MIIGLVGKKGSGKDTVADYLVSKRKFTKKAFADPLKKVIQQLFLVNPEQLSDPVKKEECDSRWNLSPRQMMQMVGTNMVRDQLGTDFWIQHMEFSYSDDSDVVISDVRFQNEADWVEKKGGILIRIQNPISSPNHQDSHISEIELEKIKTQFTIYNDKSRGLDFFYYWLDIWVENNIFKQH